MPAACALMNAGCTIAPTPLTLGFNVSVSTVRGICRERSRVAEDLLDGPAKVALSFFGLAIASLPIHTAGIPSFAAGVRFAMRYALCDRMWYLGWMHDPGPRRIGHRRYARVHPSNAASRGT